MSIKRNIFANFCGQVYTAIIGIVMLPVYVRYMGAEAYGLVGFFTVLQSWFTLLDLGLTPTIGREFSRFRAGAVDRTSVASAVRALEWSFGIIGIVCAVAIALGSGWMARDWLRARDLLQRDLQLSLIFTGLTIGTRCMSGLYRSGLASLERMITLNIAVVVTATVRSLGVLLVLHFWTRGPVGFFVFQFFVSVIDLIAIGILFYRAFPMNLGDCLPRLSSLKPLLGLSSGMLVLSVLWIIISQTDKLILSWVLSLADYGYFMVTVTLAGGILMLVAPISQALQPRLSMLAAEAQDMEFEYLYRIGTQLVTSVVVPVAGVMTCFAEPLLFAWTGNLEVAREAGRTLPLYALGNAVVALLGLAFMLQFAYGKLRWHLVGNCLFGIIWIPSAYLAATRFGAKGTGWVWLVGNLAFLILWVPYAYQKILPTLKWRWYIRDIGVPSTVIAAGIAMLKFVDLAGLSRLSILSAGVGLTLTLILAGLVAGDMTRPYIVHYWREHFS